MAKSMLLISSVLVFKPLLAGAALGSFSSLGKGTFTGAGAGAIFGLAKVLITRGDEIRLNQGNRYRDGFTASLDSGAESP